MALHRDEYGIIGQIQADGSVEGGDSACWQGHHVYLTNSDFPYVKTFEVSFGAYVRHPYPHRTNNRFGSYYKNPWNGCISRDQLTGVLGALIKQKEYIALLRLGIHWMAWLFLFSYNTVQNGVEPSEAKWKLPDPTLFNMWGMYLRGFGVISWLFFPLLVLLDLHLVVDTIFTNKDDSDDQINYTLRMLVAKDYVPTPTSWLARKLLDKNHLIGLLEKYWCGWRDNCDMYELQVSRIVDL
jgi:hypothetical protein